MAQEWIVVCAKDGKKTKKGPVTSAALQSLARSGQILPDDMVCKAGTDKWTTASSIKGLFANPETTPSASRPPLATPSNPPARAVTPTPVPERLAPTAPRQTKRSSKQRPSATPHREKPKGFWRRLGTGTKVGIIAGGAGALLLLFVVFIVVASRVVPNIPGFSKTEALEVTAKEIDEAYQANALAADEKYKGKTVQIEGVFHSVETATLTTNDGKRTVSVLKVSIHGFNCYFGDNRKNELAKLSKGQIVAVRGSFGGAHRDAFIGRFTDLMIDNCELVEPKHYSLELGAVQFYQESKEDQELFEARYKGKTVQITGKVFNAGPGGNPVFFRGGKGKLDRIACTFDGRQEEVLKRLIPGQVLTVRGTCTHGRNNGWGIELDNCGLVEAKPYSVTKIAAAELYGEYDADRNVCSKKYDGETIEITGKFTGRHFIDGVRLDAGQGREIFCGYQHSSGFNSPFPAGKIITFRGLCNVDEKSI